MKKQFILLLTGIFYAALLLSQNCLSDGIYFTSQAQIDSFPINYPYCSTIEGDLSINGSDINSLEALENIIAVNGDLLIGQQFGGHNISLSNLSGLDNIRIVGGSLVVRSNPVLQSLNGLNKIDSIGKSLKISFNDLSDFSGLDSLKYIGQNLLISNVNCNSFSGFESLKEIGGTLDIDIWDNLQSLTGLNNLERIGLDFQLQSGDLTDLTGLESLKKIGGSFTISDTYLDSLTGLVSLDTIGSNLRIAINYDLTNLNGLENLTYIGGSLNISSNFFLTNLNGLVNIEPGSIKGIWIYNNFGLNDCDALGICNYLVNPGGSINIYRNAPGCNSPVEVADSCDIVLGCLPYGNYYLLTQTQVDDFFIDYPNCTSLNGSLKIKGNDINNLEGLNGIDTIHGSLTIQGNYYLLNFEGMSSLKSIGGSFGVGYYEGNDNPRLRNFTGLEGLETIGGNVYVYLNERLTSLAGLENLHSIGGRMEIVSNDSLLSLNGLQNLDSINGDLYLNGNDLLSEISSLSELKYINGQLTFNNNESLKSLSGIDNISSDSISYIYINNNPNLSKCAVYSICQYLEDSSALVFISNNKTNCNSREEVEYDCTLEVNEINLEDVLTIYPNPTNNFLNIKDKGFDISGISIYNFYGKKVFNLNGNTNKLNLSVLNAGVYIIEFKSKINTIRKKIIVR